MKFSLKQIAVEVGGALHGDPDRQIEDVAPFETATDREITFAVEPKFLKQLDATRAGAVMVPPDSPDASVNRIEVPEPKIGFARVVRLFYPSSVRPAGVHPQAVVSEDAVIGQGASVGPFCVVGSGVQIGEKAVLHANVVVEADGRIGAESELYPGVTVLERCRIGRRVTIHPGTVVGSDGFGFVQAAEHHHKVPHIGIVEIGDDCEIGANNTIDRGTFGKTIIGCGVKTDNLVHIGHNVVIGDNALIVAQVGIAGSTTVGKNVILAGQVGLSGHLDIGDGAIVGPQAGVTRDIPAGEIMSGSPEMPHRVWLRVQRALPQLPDLQKRISRLEKKLETLETA